MGATPLFTPEVSARIKANVENWTIARWAEEYEVSYRTIQKLVLGLTYRDGIRLGPNWSDKLDRQKPGPKVLVDRQPRTVIPSNLRGKEEEIRDIYEKFLDRMAERFECKRIELLRCLAHTSPGGNRLGRAAKFNPTEVEMIREEFRQNKTYAEIGRKWGVSRTTIARVLGRGQFNEDSYTPRDDTSKVTGDAL